jgi:hypothetical protein
MGFRPLPSHFERGCEYPPPLLLRLHHWREPSPVAPKKLPLLDRLSFANQLCWCASLTPFNPPRRLRIPAALVSIPCATSPAPRSQCLQPSLPSCLKNPDGIRGSVAPCELHSVHGIPGAPHPQACSPSHGSCGCSSHTQPVSSHKGHLIAVSRDDACICQLPSSRLAAQSP